MKIDSDGLNPHDFSEMMTHSHGRDGPRLGIKRNLAPRRSAFQILEGWGCRFTSTLSVVLFVTSMATAVDEEVSRPRYYQPARSSSYSLISDTAFEVSYADGTVISGVVHEDVVQLGEFYVKTRFGGIENVVNPKREGGDSSFIFDGILGFGFPDDGNFADPLFFSLTNHASPAKGALDRRVFTLLLTEGGGELQLGGYDPDAILDREIVITPILPEPKLDSFSKYRIGVEQMSLGSDELLGTGAEAILDSGTSCLILPTDVTLGPPHSGKSPFEVFWDAYHERGPTDPLYITVEGRRFEIPYYEYNINTGKGMELCVETLTDHPDLFVLGDVFFRNVVVIHDLTDLQHPTIGLGERRRDYRIKEGDAQVSDLVDDHHEGQQLPALLSDGPHLRAGAMASPSNPHLQLSGVESLSPTVAGGVHRLSLKRHQPPPSSECESTTSSECESTTSSECESTTDRDGPDFAHHVDADDDGRGLVLDAQQQSVGRSLGHVPFRSLRHKSPSNSVRLPVLRHGAGSAGVGESGGRRGRTLESELPQTSNKVTVYNSNKLQYATEVKIGTPRQGQLMVVVDTGSTVLVVFSLHAPYSLLQLITFSVAGFFTVLGAGCLVYRHRLKKSGFFLRKDTSKSMINTGAPSTRIDYGTYNVSSTYGTYNLRANESNADLSGTAISDPQL